MLVQDHGTEEKYGVRCLTAFPVLVLGGEVG